LGTVQRRSAERTRATLSAAGESVNCPYGTEPLRFPPGNVGSALAHDALRINCGCYSARPPARLRNSDGVPLRLKLRRNPRVL
jgi:hypothetical protein